MNPFDSISLDSERGITLALQLKQQLTWLIANGQVKPADQLPPVQVMAERLKINLHTVRSAYRKMAEEGLVEIRQGRGTHVLPFDPAQLAQAAGSTRSHTIGVIVPSWANPFYHGLLQGIEEEAEDKQTLLFLCNSHDDISNAMRDAARLAAKQVDGILIASHNAAEIMQPAVRKEYQKGDLPLVSIDWPGYSGYSVLTDLRLAGYQAARHLVEHGHQRIGLISFVVDAPNIDLINQGFRQALEENGLALDTALVARVPGFSIASGAEGARILLQAKHPPTAVFAVADMLAMGAMQVFKSCGLRIPQDMALASFNNIPASALVDPGLTSVAAPTVQMGREAMKMLQNLINGIPPLQRQVILPTSLVVRHSCGVHKEP